MRKIVKVLIKSALYGDGYSSIILDKGIVSLGITEDDALERAASELKPNAKFEVLDIDESNLGTTYTIQFWDTYVKPTIKKCYCNC